MLSELFKIMDIQPDPQKFLMYDFMRGSQKMLVKVLEKHGRLRDYFGDAKEAGRQWSIQYVIADLVAQGINATLIARGHSMFQDGGHAGSNWTQSTFPRYFPMRRICDKRDETVEHVWNMFHTSQNISQEMPSFVRRTDLDFNFAVCTVKDKKYDSSWSFSIFLDPFDSWIWASLIVALMLVGLLVKTTERLGFVPAFFSSISPLLLAGQSVRIRSKLLVLWMMASMILVTFYSGEMTSLVIKPPSDLVMEKLSELEKNNYSLVFNQRFVLNFLNSSVNIMRKKDFVNEKLDLISRLLSSRDIIVTNDNEKSFKVLAEKDKVAAINGWPYAMMAAIHANHVISSRNRLPGLVAKKCYIGKELVTTGELYVTFLPPGSTQIEKVFQRLAAGGITARWYREDRAIAYSIRVQERVMVKSETSLIDNTKIVIGGLSIKGKMTTIFLVWGFGLVFNLTVFLAELFWKKNKVSFIKYYF